MTEDVIPDWRLRVLHMIVAGLLLLTAVLVGIIALGLTNPTPIGDLTLTALPETRISASEAGTEQRFDSPYQLETPGTVEVHMQHLEGPPDTLYGIILTDSSAQTVTLQVSSNGFISVEDSSDYVMLPQRWPHIHPEGEGNRLRVNVQADEVNMWVNDEFAVAFLHTLIPPLEVSYIITTLGRGSFEAQTDTVMIWQE